MKSTISAFLKKAELVSCALALALMGCSREQPRLNLIAQLEEYVRVCESDCYLNEYRDAFTQVETASVKVNWKKCSINAKIAFWLWYEEPKHLSHWSESVVWDTWPVDIGKDARRGYLQREAELARRALAALRINAGSDFVARYGTNHLKQK